MEALRAMGNDEVFPNLPEIFLIMLRNDKMTP
jgi:hypothetical protein